MKRAYNFAAGPAMLPEPVLNKVASELLSYKGLGYSIIETSHRSKVFSDVLESAQQGIKRHMNLGDNYHVLFLQGGATTDFYRIPLNLLYQNDHSAGYIHTGNWTKKAINAARHHHNKVYLAGSAEDENFSYIPTGDQLTFRENSRYIYLCSNNTIFGTQFQSYPQTKGIPLIGDFTSDIFSRAVDYNQFSLIIASAQKNLGPAGCSIVVIKDDFLKTCAENLNDVVSYKKYVTAANVLNTPPVFAIYFINEVLKWMDQVGGISALEQRNRTKAKLLYDCIDKHPIYIPVAHTAHRSLMNVTWNFSSEALTKKFIEKAAERNIVNIKGHVVAGGIRASIYNAMDISGVEQLADFMTHFAETH